MVRHMVSWNFKEGLSQEQKESVRQLMKEKTAAMVGVVPGLICAEVVSPPLSSSNCDIVLYSEVETVEQLAGYQVHPLHQQAGAATKDFVCDRRCMDILG